MTAKQEAQGQAALMRARGGSSITNYMAIMAGFGARGIEDIRPRENVLTYAAWRALGRQVRKGEHGVKVITLIEEEKVVVKDGVTAVKTSRRPWTSAVFHISQTDTIK